MNALLRLLRKIAVLLRRERFDQELQEEMAFHREQAAKEFEAMGITPEAARYAAMRQFGNATLLKERSHAVMGFRAETVVQDLRFAGRQLRRSPGLAVTAILVLALGIGASTAIFGFVDAVLIQPLPFASPNQLVDVDESSATAPRTNLSRDDYEDWKRLNTTLSSLDVYGGTGFLLRMGSLAVPVPAARVSDGFFRTLGVEPMLGRGFRPGEDRPGQPKIAILSYGTWLKRFGGRRDVIGESVSLTGEAYTIVGVLPRDFAFALRASAEFWVPLLDKNGCEKRRSCHNLDGVGRLGNGSTAQAAFADLKGIAAQLAVVYPGSNKGQSASVLPLSEVFVRKLRPTLVALLAGAGLLLLIACVNVASLLLVRAESRRRETAVRGALGATPGRLVQQFVTEGLLLAGLGCAAGAALAVVMMSLLTRIIPKPMAQGMPFLSVVGLNRHTALFAAGVTLMAAVLLAAAPALRLAFREIHDGLTDGGKGAASRFWSRRGANLVVVELAVAVVLLASAGLLAKSFYRLLHVETGFDTSHLATVYVMAPENVYGKPEQQVALYHQILEKVSALPGVRSAGITSDLPLQCNCSTDWIRIPGRPYHGEHNDVLERDVSPQYLDGALGARLVRGRMLSEADDLNHSQVIILNESMARKYFPGEDPIGKMIGDGDLTPKSMRQVVGVIEDVREGALDDEAWPAEYFSIYHGPDSYFEVAARTAQDENALLPVLVKTLRAINPNLGIFGESTMSAQMSTSQSALLHRFSSWLVGGFATMALVLAVVGLYGVIAFSVSQRTREIGVRMALGAQRGAIHRLILKEAGWLTGMGILIGLACSVAAAELMGSLLFGVRAWDLSTLVGVAAVLGFSALLASLIPARRASSVNPVQALSTE